MKIVIAGGLGAGKTTLVGAVSEIDPIRTEAWMTTQAAAVDAARPGKTTTTVAMDFGRITLRNGLTVYLFGTPGQPRFWPMWDDVARGASAAIVLVDSRDLASSWAALDYFDQRRVPYIVVINRFHGRLAHTEDEVRAALRVSAHIPVISADVRDRAPVVGTLVAAVRHTLSTIHPPRSLRPAPSGSAATHV